MADITAPGGPCAQVAAVAFVVSDIAGAARFFETALDFEVVPGDTGRSATSARSATLRLGAETVVLDEPLRPGRPVPADSRSNDLWFQHVAVVVSDIRGACDHLNTYGIEHTSPGPQRLPAWNPDAGGIEASYLRDPDGHPLELISFPPGKGEARWQSKERLFLGIDHTSIAVSSTEAALRFYCDGLGLDVQGRSENWGPEQESLSGCPAPGSASRPLEGPAAPEWSSLTTCRRRPGGRIPPTPVRRTCGTWRPGFGPQISRD